MRLGIQIFSLSPYFFPAIMEVDSASHPTINCFQEEHSTSSVELRKKRKLQHESGLPSPKHNCRDRSGSSDHGCPTADGKERENSYESIVKEGTDKNVANELDQATESDKDSNSYVGDHDTGMIWEGDKIEIPSSKALFGDKPYPSWNSCKSNTFKNDLYSLESRRIKETNSWEKAKSMHGRYTSLDAVEQLEADYRDTEDHHPGLEIYGDYITGFENNGTSNGVTDDVLLYSNALTSNEFVLSSGRWNVRQDAQLGARKPTIDQEFEQYFSMLMLQ